MHNRTLMILIIVVTSGCATAPDPAPPGTATREDAAPASATAPTLRLLRLSPTAGVPVDSSTVITATLAYHIPDFDPTTEYHVTAVFAGRSGGSFNRGRVQEQIRSPAGILTVRHPLSTLLSEDWEPLASPLTGVFFLLERPQDMEADTVEAGDRRRIRVVRQSAGVRARTHTFFYNGGGPSRTFSQSVPDQLEEYLAYQPHKAIAIAYHQDGRWALGYGYGFQTPAAAVDRALDECRASAQRRGVAGECRVVAVDDGPADSW